MAGGDAFWLPLPGGAGGGGGLVEAFAARSSTTVTVNPVALSAVNALSVTLPASTSPRSAIVSAVVQHSGGTPRRFMVYMDGAKAWPFTASLATGDSSSRLNDFSADGMIWRGAGIVIAVPGDSAPHQIQIWWEPHTNTNSTDLWLRSLAVFAL